MVLIRTFVATETQQNMSIKCCLFSLSSPDDLAHGQSAARTDQLMNERALLKVCCGRQSAQVVKSHPHHPLLSSHRIAACRFLLLH